MEMWGTELDSLKTPKQLGQHYADKLQLGYELDEMERAIRGEDDAGHGFSWTALAIMIIVLHILGYFAVVAFMGGYHQ